jgi:hypothetical protein
MNLLKPNKPLNLTEQFLRDLGIQGISIIGEPSFKPKIAIKYLNGTEDFLISEEGQHEEKIITTINEIIKGINNEKKKIKLNDT